MKGTPQRKRIAVVIPKFGLVGGAEAFASELTARVAADSRFDMHVFANRWLGEIPGVSYHRVPILRFPRSIMPLSFAWFAQQAISGAPYDLIHAQDRIFEADCFTMHGIPHRLWVRDVRKKSRLSLFDKSMCRVEERLVSNPRCRIFLAVSSLAGEKFREVYGTIDAGRVRVISPGTDVGRFARLDRHLCRHETRQSLGLAPDAFILLFVSMNFEVKGLDYVIRGLSRLRERGPMTLPTLLVIGRGDEAHYRRLASGLGIAGQVRFSGVTGKEMLDPLYMASDAFAMLSRFDTFGMAALDAMGASLPVILSGNVGAKDLVKNGENGYVIGDPADADAVADAMGTLLSADDRIRMGQNANRTAAGQSWDTVAARYIQVYEELLRAAQL